MAKLLMISGDRALASGAKGAFYNTLEEFHKHWERVDIICPRPATSHKLQATSYFGNVFIHPSPWPLIFQPWWILKKGKELFREYKFELITTHEYPPFYNGFGACWLHHAIGVPYVLELMHIPGYPRAGSIKEKFYAWLTNMYIRYDVRYATAVRVINQRETPEFLKRAGVPAEKLAYIPAMYINTDVFRPLAVQKEYDLVFAARLERNKGITELLEALAYAKQTLPGIRLLIVGTGSLKRTLERYVRDHRLDQNVVFSGWLPTADDVSRAYNSARVFINPSYNEGGPRVVLEAMACGLPVITTRVGAMHDLIVDGENALFTDWEPEMMGHTIVQLLSDAALQEKFSAAGPLLAQRFERRVMIGAYADALKKVLAVPAEVSRMRTIAGSIHGFTSPRSGELLYRLAKQCLTGSAIVEIGSWKGRSTLWLALGSKHGFSAKVYAVDPHTGSREHRRRYGEQIDTYDEFIANMQKAGVADVIEPARKTSVEFARDFKEPVGLIFIDGDHSYGAVKEDFLAWFSKVVEGGVMAFDDSIGWDGPQKVVDEYLFRSRHFKDVRFLGPIAYGTKVGKNTFIDRCMNRYRLFLKNVVWFCVEGPLIHIKVPSIVQRFARAIVYFLQ